MNQALSGKQVLTSSETAQMLGISVASVRNWVRHGFITSISSESEYAFLRDDVLTLQSRIKSGEIKRLGSRANKIRSTRTFIPDELFQHEDDRKKVMALSALISGSGADPSSAMFAVSLALLERKSMLAGTSAEKILMSDSFTVKGRKKLTSILRSWKTSVPHFFNELLCDIIHKDIPEQKNITGIIYQSIIAEGEKSKLGSYYTPDRVASGIAERLYSRGPMFLDPCCGTGQFLIAFAEKYGTAENVWGVDIDPVAVNLARINLMLMFPEKDDEPRIFCNDSLMSYNERLLFDDISSLPDFNVIATNPPWGSHYRKEELARLAYYYPEITSGESFSCFLVKSSRMLKPEGCIAFVLPEAVMNVKMHSDIRRYMLSNCTVTRIEFLDRLFRNVFSPTVILDLDSRIKSAQPVDIILKNESYTVKPERFRRNRDVVFDINLSPEDEKILERVYSVKHVTLQENATWLLGIVTGNNELYISNSPDEDKEPVLKGKDIVPFRILEPDSYIKFEPEKFQQAAPEYMYRRREKLVYRYISSSLVFAMDREGRLTLNSANTVIPEIPGVPMKFIMGLFNSELYQFIFRKKFNSLKVLRSHIEELPVPLLPEPVVKSFIKIVEAAERGEGQEGINNMVYAMFGLGKREIDQVRNSLS